MEEATRRAHRSPGLEPPVGPVPDRTAVASGPGARDGSVGLLVAGCSSSGTSATTSSTTQTTASPPTTQGGTTTTGPQKVYEVHTGTVKGLGTVLVDGQGMTLYLFVPDKQRGRRPVTAPVPRPGPHCFCPRA